MINLEEIKEQIKTYKNTKQDIGKYGEVFTPLSIVNEMLDELPKEVWSNPNLKWLDPANGVGNFPVIVVSNLMDGLKEWQPDLELRLKHILENMIYVCELQSKIMIIYLKLFNPENKYKLNFHIGSFLDDGFSEVMKEWGLDGFDLVVGNPPYTKGIWIKFLKKLLPLCKKYSVIISPDGTKNKSKVSENLINLLQSNNIQSLTNHTHFFKVKCGELVTYYFNKELSPNNFAHIINDNKTKILNKILNYKGNKIISKLSNNRSKIFNSQDKKDNIFENFNIKIIENIKRDGVIFKYLDNNNILNKNIIKYDLREWFITNRFIGKDNNPSIYNISENISIGSNIIIIKKWGNGNIENFKNIFSSKLFIFILNILRNGMFDTSPRHLNLLPQLDLSKSWTDEELYNYFNLTPEEIQLIEETISEPTKKKKSKKKHKEHK